MRRASRITLATLSSSLGENATSFTCAWILPDPTLYKAKASRTRSIDKLVGVGCGWSNRSSLTFFSELQQALVPGLQQSRSRTRGFDSVRWWARLRWPRNFDFRRILRPREPPIALEKRRCKRQCNHRSSSDPRALAAIQLRLSCERLATGSDIPAIRFRAVPSASEPPRERRVTRRSSCEPPTALIATTIQTERWLIHILRVAAAVLFY